MRLTWRVVSGDRVLQAGLLTLEETAPDRVDLDPVLHSPPGWEVVPRWLARARATAYAGSREGRGQPGGASRASSARASWGANPFASLSK